MRALASRRMQRSFRPSVIRIGVLRRNIYHNIYQQGFVTASLSAFGGNIYRRKYDASACLLKNVIRDFRRVAASSERVNELASE